MSKISLSPFVSVWKNMGSTHHASWDMYALNMNMSSLNADADPGTGEIICVFSLPVIQPEKRIVFFAQRIEEVRISDYIPAGLVDLLSPARREIQRLSELPFLR